MRTHRVSVNLTPQEFARLQELRPESMSDSAFFRTLLREAAPISEAPMTRMAALRLLSESAQAGKVAAQIALARELREGDRDAVREWILNG